MSIEADGPQGVLQTIFINGWIGVDLFFVLSGYLIAQHLIRAGVGTTDFHLGRYVAMRVLRIVPAYYSVMLLTAAGAFPLFLVPPDAIGVRIGYHLLFLQDYLPSDINVVFWSLGVEEKFYLLAPLLVLVLLRCRTVSVRLALLFVLFAAPVVLRAAVFLPVADTFDYPQFWRIFRSPFHMALEGLVVGVALALAQHAGLVRSSRVVGLSLMAGSVLFLFVWTSTHDFLALIGMADAIVHPPVIALLAGAVTLGGIQLAGTPMPFAGLIQLTARLSYSLYLIHYPLIPLVEAVTLPYGPAAFWTGYFAISIVAGSLLHLAIERPFLRLKDRLAQESTQANKSLVNVALGPDGSGIRRKA